jgi:hypothetical protein
MVGWRFFKPVWAREKLGDVRARAASSAKGARTETQCG